MVTVTNVRPRDVLGRLPGVIVLGDPRRAQVVRLEWGVPTPVDEWMLAGKWAQLLVNSGCIEVSQ